MEPKFGEKIDNTEKLPTKIKMEFFRHSIKGAVGPDGDVYLSEGGREEATDPTRPLENPSLAKAWGSERIRTQETAVLRMDGSLEIAIDDAKLQSNTLGTKRVEADPEDRLNFLAEPGTVTGDAGNAAYKDGRYLSHIINDSDRLVTENEEWENTSYSTQAASIADIVLTYLENASDRWEDLYRKDTGEDGEQRKFPKEYKPTLERFFGSHQSVNESFLAKVLQKTEGSDRVIEFLEALDGMGFVENEGFELNIENNGADKKIIVSYAKVNEEGETIFEMEQELSPELLDEIISEGDLQSIKTEEGE